VVYELNRVMGSEKHLALEKVEFKNWVSNNFDTKKEMNNLKEHLESLED
jgi:hypothetical protein